MAVLEISDLIMRGDYRDAGVSDEDALDSLNHHLLTVRQIHGPEAVESLMRFAHGTAAKHFEEEDAVRDNIDEFIEDYTKALNAHSQAPPGKEREVLEKALKEIWERRRGEKAAKQREEDTSKK